MNEAEKLVRDRIYRDKRLRAEVRQEMRKRPDVAMNGIMLIVSRLYIDGIRDGAAFGEAGPAYLAGEAWVLAEDTA